MRLVALTIVGVLLALPALAEEQPAPAADTEIKVGQEPKAADGAAIPGTASGEAPAEKGSTAPTRTPGCDSLNDPVMRLRCVEGQDHVP